MRLDRFADLVASMPAAITADAIWCVVKLFPAPFSAPT